MNLLIFNLAVDEKHVTLAFALEWIEKLSSHFEHIDVLTMKAGHYRLPDNVTVWSVGREHDYSEWVRALRFYWLLGKILRRRYIDVVFTHMIPVFAVLCWPFTRPMAIKNVLWYEHGSTPFMLRLAHRLVDAVVTATPHGFRLKSEKVKVIGHGIDVTRYKASAEKDSKKFRIVTIGRIAPSKGADIIISALSKWKTEIDWHLTIVGDGTSPDELDYAKKLRIKAGSCPQSPRITFSGRMKPCEIPSILNQCDLFVNMSSTGSLDKAILEAMASGCPVVSSNEAFHSLASAEGFPECAIQRSEEDLLTALQSMVSMNESRRKNLGARQAEVVDRGHTLDGLIKQLVEILYSNARSKAAQ